MKVLLAGASGYLGRAIFTSLLRNGHDVTCLSRSGHPGASSSRLRWLQHDLTKPLMLPDRDFELVIHAAGANDIFSRDPGQAIQATALTARYSAEFAMQQKMPRLIYISTFQVYGRESGRVSESSDCKPINDYAMTHLFAEQWIEQVARAGRLDWLHVRPANIAGVPESGTMRRWTLVPGCFCRQAVSDGKIVLRSSGLQQRDFLSLSRVADRITAVGENFSRYIGAPLNICSGASISILDAARLVADRYEHHFGRPCDVEAPTDEDGTGLSESLLIDSRLFNDFPEWRLGYSGMVAELKSSIDETYELLRD